MNIMTFGEFIKTIHKLKLVSITRDGFAAELFNSLGGEPMVYDSTVKRWIDKSKDGLISYGKFFKDGKKPSESGFVEYLTSWSSLDWKRLQEAFYFQDGTVDFDLSNDDEDVFYAKLFEQFLSVLKFQHHAESTDGNVATSETSTLQVTMPPQVGIRVAKADTQRNYESDEEAEVIRAVFSQTSDLALDILKIFMDAATDYDIWEYINAYMDNPPNITSFLEKIHREIIQPYSDNEEDEAIYRIIDKFCETLYEYRGQLELNSMRPQDKDYIVGLNEQRQRAIMFFRTIEKFNSI